MRMGVSPKGKCYEPKLKCQPVFCNYQSPKPKYHGAKTKNQFSKDLCVLVYPFRERRGGLRLTG